MRHVFVSYSRMDTETVDHIVARLSKDGFDVWLDRQAFKGGDVWREAIVEAVDNAYACVLMLSPNSVASDNVRKEVDLAEGASKNLIPLMLATVELPAKQRYQLAGIQWIEYYRDPEAKYAELTEVLHARKPKQIIHEAQLTHEAERLAWICSYEVAAQHGHAPDSLRCALQAGDASRWAVIWHHES